MIADDVHIVINSPISTAISFCMTRRLYFWLLRLIFDDKDRTTHVQNRDCCRQDSRVGNVLQR
jgi:hypothetical protein